MPALELHIDPAAAIDIYVHPSAYPPSTLPGDLIAIRPVHVGKGKGKDRPLLYKVEAIEADETSGSKGRRGKAQIIVNGNVTKSFNWVKNRTEVELTLVLAPPPPHMTATYIELYWSNLYLGRSDMFRLSLSLTGSVLYLNQRVTLAGSMVRLRVGGIINQEGQSTRSAWISDDTRIIFRSESARCFIFVEISQEMWHFEEDGSMLREKCEMFLTELFQHFAGQVSGGIDDKSKGQATSHTVSIILYGRVIYEDNGSGEEERAPLSVNEEGLLYRDFYKVVLDLTPSPSPSVVRVVSNEIRRWQEEVLLRLRASGEMKLAGRIAWAHESNVLEAVNLALNSFEEHWIDRDLQRTGLLLLVLTAGTSYYQVPKSLLRLTTERMLFHGIGLDLVSLSKTPLHTVPLFSFHSHEPGLSEEGSIKESTSSPGTTRTQGKRDLVASEGRVALLPDDQRDPLYYDSPYQSQEMSVYYAEPLFVFCAFFGVQIDKPHRIDRFMPRARCYELFSQGAGERLPIAIPLLPVGGELEKEEEGWSYLSEVERKQARRDKYDALAIGASVDPNGVATWNIQSGASGQSRASGDRMESGDSKESRDRAPVVSKPVISIKRPELSRTGSNDAQNETDREERDRGRAGQYSSEVRRIPSSTRSRTPIARQRRSSSVATSIRTVSSAVYKTGTRKASTPALIARLTPAAMAAPTNSTTTTAKAGWLGIFRSGDSGAAKSQAPSVAVHRIDARANVRHELDLEGFQPVSKLSHCPTSPSSSRRSSNATALSRPSQPISISTRTAQTREADKPTKRQSDPPIVSQYGPVLEMQPKDTGDKSFASRFNPSKPGKRSVGLADQARRWASIFIRHSNDQRAVNWISITRGATLPITTDYLPSADALTHQYSDYRYSIPTHAATTSFLLRTDQVGRSSTLELVLELVAQRLSHGFQICTPANAIGALDEINLPSSKTVPDVLKDIDGGEGTAVYLSLANQIHRIAYDRRSQSVSVKIMRRKRTWVKSNSDYGALIWTQGMSAYTYNKVEFPFPKVKDLQDWQHLDRVVAGIEKPDQSPALRYWRTRLVLLPAATIPDRSYVISSTKALEGLLEVSDLDINKQGFHVLMNAIQAAQWIGPGASKESVPTEITDLSPPEWAAKIARESDGGPASDLSPGLSIRPSRWLRRMTTNPALQESANENTVEGDRSNSPSRAKDEETPNGINTDRERPTVQMSYSIVLDLDPQKRSSRAERVLCHFDRSHNPQAAYHIELTWLAGSGRIIDNTIQRWSSQVSRYGLNLIEASARAVETRHNPFQQPNLVTLAVSPPAIPGDSNLADKYYEAELLRRMDYFLDIGASDTFPSEIDVQYSYRRVSARLSQYIHRSGRLLVAILDEGQGFIYAPNRIFTSHTKTKADDAIKELVDFCGDPVRLAKLWTSLTVQIPSQEVIGT